MKQIDTQTTANANEMVAIQVLSGSERGRVFLRNFRRMMLDGAVGFDSENWKAAQLLFKSAAAGKRNFIDLM